jgi:hypothetical protein
VPRSSSVPLLRGTPRDSEELRGTRHTLSSSEMVLIRCDD